MNRKLTNTISSAIVNAPIAEHRPPQNISINCIQNFLKFLDKTCPKFFQKFSISSNTINKLSMMITKKLTCPMAGMIQISFQSEPLRNRWWVLFHLSLPQRREYHLVCPFFGVKIRGILRIFLVSSERH